MLVNFAIYRKSVFEYKYPFPELTNPLFVYKTGRNMIEGIEIENIVKSKNNKEFFNCRKFWQSNNFLENKGKW